MNFSLYYYRLKFSQGRGRVHVVISLAGRPREVGYDEAAERGAGILSVVAGKAEVGAGEN